MYTSYIFDGMKEDDWLGFDMSSSYFFMRCDFMHSYKIQTELEGTL